MTKLEVAAKLFGIAGAMATVASAYLGWLALTIDSNTAKVSGLTRIQLALAVAADFPEDTTRFATLSPDLAACEAEKQSMSSILNRKDAEIALLHETGSRAQVTTTPPVSASASAEERFVSYGTGIVYDKKNRLEWTDTTSPSPTATRDVREWVASHNRGSQSGWRVPTVPELQSLYDPEASGMGTSCPAGKVRVSAPIKFYCSEIWTTRSNSWIVFDFSTGQVRGSPTDKTLQRALAVRSVSP